MIVSVPTAKNNGVVYFAKGLKIAEVLQKVKTNTDKKIAFSLKMFSKKLYGKIVSKTNGCYGNWEVNLTWEDEMQGRIKHDLAKGKCFGPENFFILVEL